MHKFTSVVYMLDKHCMPRETGCLGLTLLKLRGLGFVLLLGFFLVAICLGVFFQKMYYSENLWTPRIASG